MPISRWMLRIRPPDGFEAYRMIRELRPDIVLIDIEMPGMSGLDVIKKIKQEAVDTVFIIISSYQEFSYAQDALRLDVEDYLLKPFLPGDVCGAIYKAAKRLEFLRALPLMQNSPALPEGEATLAQRMRSVLVYPFEQEKQLIEALRFDGEEANISAALEAFIDAVHENDSVPAAADCYDIVYVELCRLLADLHIDAALPSAPAVSEENCLEAMETYLRGLCPEINRRLRGQSGSRADERGGAVCERQLPPGAYPQRRRGADRRVGVVFEHAVPSGNGPALHRLPPQAAHRGG